ncbi:MAG: PD40 domain-containing protein [Labilithrix sp.]|nr:PD40 domain-containing protein [Labilithrix sp.]
MLTLGLTLFACDDELEDDPAEQAGGALSGTFYWTDSASVEIHKLDLATGADTKLGGAHQVRRAPDGKLLIVGAKGIEETDEAVISTRVIKTSDVNSVDDAEVNYVTLDVSPDGTKIAYDTLGSASYVCSRADGAVVARLQPQGERDTFSRPTWTPDGRIVASGSFFKQGIYISDAALTTMTRIDPNLEQPRQAAVSPDGTKVAFILKKLVFVMNVDGSGLTQIDTDDTENDSWPTWSPDGKSIAYYATAGHLKIRPAAGGAAIDVFDTYPALASKIVVFGTSAPPHWVAL